MNPCDRCDRTPVANPYALYDYCANCQRTLCDQCMADGCCGYRPALSGMTAECAEGEG